MIRILMLCLTLFCFDAGAQNTYRDLYAPTTFDKFIMSPSIDWAYYSFDTLRLEHFDLVNVLLARINKNEIKAAEPPQDNRTDAFKWLSKSDLQKKFHRTDTVMVYKGEGVEEQKVVSNTDVTCDTGVVRTTVIYYVADGKLKAYVPWINVISPVYTSYGMYLGKTNSISASINTDYKFINKESDKLYFITRVTKTIKLDSLIRDYMLKEMYGKNLVETVWSGVLDGKNKLIPLSPKVGNTGKAIQYSEKKPLAIDEIKELANGGDYVVVPIYDSIGNITDSRNVSLPLTASSITSIVITENWFYDHTANKMICKIPEIILLVNSDRVLKIIF